MSATNLKYLNWYFDSDEEVYFAMWLHELQQAGFVKEWKKVKEPIPLTHGKKIPYTKITKLKTKTKEEQKEFNLLNASEYTPDFEVLWTMNGLNKFLFQIAEHEQGLRTAVVKQRGGIIDPREALFFSAEYNTTLVEVKPSFDQQNMERLFKNNQKFIWDKYKTFVNLIEPIELLKKTFVPYAAMQYLVYRKKPTSAKNKHKNVGDFKYDFHPKTLNEFLCPSLEK